MNKICICGDKIQKCGRSCLRGEEGAHVCLSGWGVIICWTKSKKNENASLDFLNGILDAHVLGEKCSCMQGWGPGGYICMCTFVQI